MTSFAFILGCVPLWTASGAGSVARQIMGTTVIGGMVAASVHRHLLCSGDLLSGGEMVRLGQANVLFPASTQWAERRVNKMRDRQTKFQHKGGASILVPSRQSRSPLAVGPNYHRPNVQIPASFRAPDETQQAEAQTASFADLPWWQAFQDPQLQGMIRTALKQNYDLQLAVERVTAARAQLGITRSNQFPQVSADPNFNGGKLTKGSNIQSFLTRRRCDRFNWTCSDAIDAPPRRPAPSCWALRMPNRP